MTGNDREIRLLSIPGKVIGTVLMERVQQITKDKIGEEWDGFRTGRVGKEEESV